MVIESATYVVDAMGRRTAVILPIADYERLLEELHSSNGDDQPAEPIPLASLFGAGKGAFDTPADADAFIRAERDAWGH